MVQLPPLLGTPVPFIQTGVALSGANRTWVPQSRAPSLRVCLFHQLLFTQRILLPPLTDLWPNIILSARSTEDLVFKL